MPLEPRIWSKTTEVSEQGSLVVGGVDVRTLAQQFGTPLFVLDEADVKSRAAAFHAAFGEGDIPFGIHYASKAFASADVLRWVVEAGLGVDVATGGELALALAAGVPGNKIVVHGNNKSISELQRAIDAGVSRIVVDSFDEIDRLVQIAVSRQKDIDVLIRLTVGVEAHTHEFISTAHEDQKFGLSIATGAAERAVLALMGAKHLNLRGFHSHIGSQIFDTNGFEIAAKRILGFVNDMRLSHKFITEEVDLGGGMGIAYLPTDDPLTPEVMAESLRSIVKKECEKLGIEIPKLSIEPGRAIVGPSMMTIYEVGTIKPVELESGATRLYVSVDGGMSDNIRTALYDAQYTPRLASRRPLGTPVQARVVGKHCESGDIVVRDCFLASDVAPGDLLAVAATGAYHRSMASNYNMLTRPAVVAVKNGEAKVLIRRETEADLLALDEGLNR
jgi:diaminopimelate decarboxylase